MFIKNVAIPGFTFTLINRSDGSAVTSGTVNTFITKDGGAQVAATNIPTHVGNGQWVINLEAVEMDADIVGLLFMEATATTVSFTIKTEVPDTTLYAFIVDSNNKISDLRKRFIGRF